MPKIFCNAREPLSSYSHFIGAGLSIFGFIIILLKMAITGVTNSLTATSVILFCLSLIALYSASSIYHFSNKGERTLKILKKLDHSMIYVLIAGSYSPVLCAYLPKREGIAFAVMIWAAAFAGIMLKMRFIDAPRFLGTILYIVMGWAIVFDLPAIMGMPWGAMALLVGGGISYTIGGIIYIAKKPNISEIFGFHELFHIFVVIGSIFHYLMVLNYVV